MKMKGNNFIKSINNKKWTYSQLILKQKCLRKMKVKMSRLALNMRYKIKQIIKMTISKAVLKAMILLL